jgi:ABC-type dipeptide/oligopeptide/nickel transport system permease subunit
LAWSQGYSAYRPVYIRKGQGFLEIDKTRKRGLRPGIAISLAVFALNLFGDSLRDFLDPRFKV